jgi:2-keto-3-deoxy-L-rhamnonate aldolase RhmA
VTGVFRERLRAGEPLRGIFVRTPSHHVIEVLAARADPVDCVIIDCEHAPIDTVTLDVMLAVATAIALPALVRVPALERAAIQQALDLGATGVVVPHVDSARLAASAARWSHYGDGGRGFSPSTRSARWGSQSMAEVLDAAAAATTVVIQIEDPAAIEVIDEIVAIEGIDGVLLGRADLAVAYGARDIADERVTRACESVAAACRRAGVPLAVVAADARDASAWGAAGAMLLIAGTDQRPSQL